VDSAEPVAEKIFDLLKTSELQSNSHKNGTLSCYISDVFSQFKTIAERFLEGPIADVTTVDLL
jgi:glutamate racemase